MLKELTILELFFQDPKKTYSARQISRACGINHITVAKKLKAYRFIERAKYGPYEGYRAAETLEFTQLRFVRNYLKLQESGLIGHLLKVYSYPTVVLFGSYASATQSPNSDIDILVVAEKKEAVPLKEFEKMLGHRIQLFLHDQTHIRRLEKESPHLVNSWCNGIVLNGELEVFQ
ncbi:MAG: nucleotidyltransferase domain-containing protein [Candidatus Woesearchaeota archaeon]